MSETLSQQQRDAVLGLSADKRYDYFVGKVVETGQVWSLRSDKGWVMVSTDGAQCLPVWPHPDFARDWATGDWADCQPVSIDLKAWTERWLPGMQEDEIAVAVFPSADEQGVVVEPEELLDSMVRD